MEYDDKAAALASQKEFLKRLQDEISSTCYVILYKNTGMSGKTLRLDGPAQYRNLKNLPGSDEDWGDSIGSIETGPNARLVVFDDEDFSGDHIDTYGPNTRTSVSGDLDDNIDSLQIFQV